MKMKPIILIESEEQLLEYKGKPLTPEEEKEFALKLIEKWSHSDLYVVRVVDEETPVEEAKKES